MFQLMTGCIKSGNKIPTEEELKKLPSFMFCKWLSGERKMVNTANLFNNFSDIPIRSQYIMVQQQFQNKIGFVKYPKKMKEDTSKKIEVVGEMLDLSYEKTLDYVSLMSKEEYKMLKKSYDLKRTR